MATMSERITAEEFLARPEEDRFAQLIGGEVIVNPPAWQHQRIVSMTIAALSAWTDAAPDRGEVNTDVAVRISDEDVFAPDVVWVATANLPDPDATFLRRPPDLAVEVRSPSTWRYDIGAKRLGYERAGLQELWLVDPSARTVTVLRRTSAEAPRFDVSLTVAAPEPLTSPLLPGFALDLEKLFA